MPVDPALTGYRQQPFEVTLERGRLRAFAASIGDTDPLATDVDAARAAGHPDLVAPPTILFGIDLENSDTFEVLSAHGVVLDRVLHGEQSFEYFGPIHAGDTLRFQSEFTSVASKAGGRLDVIDRKTDVTKDGRIIARLSSVSVVQNGEKA
jgi:acyl dehydratase